MIAKLLFILFLAAYFTAHFGDRKGLGAEPRSQDTVQANETIEQFITYRHKQWDGLIKDAGKVKGGLLLVARVSPEQATVAEKFRLSFYIKDVTELPSRISRDRYGGTVQLVLVRDAHGKPVRLTAEGLNRINSVAAESSYVTRILFPGDAATASYPLSTDFAIEQPGKYSILATWRGGSGGILVAEPLEFTLKDKAAPGIGKEHVQAQSPIAPNRVASPAPGADEEWNTLLKTAGAEVGGCILEGVVSPYSPSAVHLVVSVKSVRYNHVKTGWHNSHPTTYNVRVGRVPSNYRILIRDSAGKAVPMTGFGREFFQHREKEYPADVLEGCAVGTWLPLDELFCLKSGEEYTVLAMLPEKLGSLGGLVSQPLKIRVPQLPVAGLTRPLYGSDELWTKLVARTSVRDPILAIDCEIAHSDQPFDPAGVPRITIRNRSGRAFGSELASAETTVLVRDLRGKPMFPIAVKEEYDLGNPLWTRLAKEYEQLDATPFGPVGGEAEPPGGSQEVESFPRFPRRYPIIPGEPYTILVAVRTRGDRPAFVVAAPLTYVPRPDGDFRFNPERGIRNLLPDAALKPAPSIRTEWDSLIRFAGSPFGDLLLTASAGKRGGLEVSLINQGKQPIVVKKWEGSAGFDVQIRNADGKPVPLTEKGKALFQGGASLDIRNVKPQEKIKVTLPIEDLFEMKTPGDYTVLASLPVIGDVDAVLTAAPVKVRVEAKAAAGKK